MATGIHAETMASMNTAQGAGAAGINKKADQVFLRYPLRISFFCLENPALDAGFGRALAMRHDIKTPFDLE